MRARVKIKHSDYGTLYVGTLTSARINLSSREFDDYQSAEDWLTKRIKSEIDRATSKDSGNDKSN